MDEIINKEFGELTVKYLVEVKRIPKKDKADYIKYYYWCDCKCGGGKKVERGNLIHHHTLSCGCLKKRKGKDNKCWKGFEEISGRFWTHIMRHAQSRNFLFNITIEDAWQQFKIQNRKCALTGWDLNLESGKKTASLDRIDNKKGYEKDNIQWLHKDVNWMKGKFTTKRFLEICEAVAKNQQDLPQNLIDGLENNEYGRDYIISLDEQLEEIFS